MDMDHNSQEDLTRSENFLSYQATEFEKAWSQISDTSESKLTTYESESDSGISGVSSPTISSTYQIPPSFEEEDSMDLNWLSQGGFAFDQIDPTPDSTDVLSPPEQRDTTGVEFSTDYLRDFDFLPDDMDLNDIFEDKKKPMLMHEDDHDDLLIVSTSAVQSSSSSSLFSKEAIDSLPDININYILSSKSSNFVVNSALISQQQQGPSSTTTNTTQAQEQQQQHSYNTRTTHQRKAAPGQRVVAPSPYHTPNASQAEEITDVKPNMAILDGQIRGRKRINSSIDYAAVASPSPSTSKKPRKYEIEDVTDPSVRNAKAAKMNRDRKKTEFLEMKKRAEAAEAMVSTLHAENASLKSSVEAMKTRINEDLVKKRTETGLNRQMTTMKTVFEAILPAMQQKFGRPMAVQVPDSFATIPATLDENGQFLSESGEQFNEEGFNILDESYQMSGSSSASMDNINSPAANSSNFFTLHINPQGGTIKLDYDPSFQ